MNVHHDRSIFNEFCKRLKIILLHHIELMMPGIYEVRNGHKMIVHNSYSNNSNPSSADCPPGLFIRALLNRTFASLYFFRLNLVQASISSAS